MYRDGIDVVIPARNEQDTIGPIVDTFISHPAIDKVIVVVDADTVDDTAVMAGSKRFPNGWVINNVARGKGQCVMAGLMDVRTDYVVFCDADVTGLTYDHVSLLVADAIIGGDALTIGVPDVPNNYPTERIWAWPWVSGQRCVPTKLVRPLELHGYLMEVQINAAARWAGLPVCMEWLRGLKSKYQITDVRIREMERDHKWGREKGIV
jgi:glycosyltransferase involved in cell wall biosynthesis